MEEELKATRKELESTKQTLKVQTARCRHLVAAFTQKLAEKDAEVKACRRLQEKQLSTLLRALLVLEARLKREQKSIKVLLAEKDNLINEQKVEIKKLKELSDIGTVLKESEQIKVEEERECFAKPDLISSLGIEQEQPDSLEEYPNTVLNVHDRSAFSIVKKDYVKSTPPDISQYQDTPVLQCVNQILLKDQEDFLEEQRLRKDKSWLEEDEPEDDTDVKLEHPPLPPKPKINSKKVGFADLDPIISILEPIEQPDSDLYVISNSALDDDIVKQLRGRTLNVTGFKNQKSGFSPKNEPQQSHQPKTILKMNIQESPKSYPFKSPPKVGMPNMIKVASPVASLLTAEKSNVSQMVKKFEEINTNVPPITKKDEKTDDIQSESYDNFLEATGLSTKSIMTPSRLVTNHRSVLKPKDVKLRSRVRTAAVVERSLAPQVVGPTVKYWTEPFL